jgi:hypothetical protein
MDNELRDLTLMNTKGIHCLVMGKKNFIPRAVQAFKQALAQLENVRSADYTTKPCCQPKSSLEGNVLEVFNSSPLCSMEAQQDSFYVYNRAVFFKPLSDTSSIGLTFYNAILQFNLALTYHIKAHTSKDSKTIQRSLKLYKTCLKTLRELGVGGGSMAGRPPHPGGGETMIYLRLAALNNLSHIYSLTGDYDKVNDTLAKVFKFTVAQRPVLFSEDNHPEDCADEFVSSTTRDCSGILADRRTIASMNSAFVNEVLLNVMVAGPVSGAPMA